MKLANRKKKFTIEDAIVSTVYQLRICTQKTTNVTPFQAHFGRKQVTGERNDILIEEAMTKAQVDAGRRHNREQNQAVSRFMFHPKLFISIPRTERSVELKLARKVSKRSKRDLRGVWDTLAPGSTVVRTSPTKTVMKEPGVLEEKVCNSDIEKSVRWPNAIETFGKTHKGVLSHTIRPRRRKFLSTQKS